MKSLFNVIACLVSLLIVLYLFLLGIYVFTGLNILHLTHERVLAGIILLALLILLGVIVIPGDDPEAPMTT